MDEWITASRGAMASKTGKLYSLLLHFEFYERPSYLPEDTGLEGLT
jgi:hypothetical protein